MPSFFAPSKRTDRRKFKNQIADISQSPLMTAIIDDIDDEQTCAITTERDGSFSDLCLQIKAHPFDIQNNR